VQRAHQLLVRRHLLLRDLRGGVCEPFSSSRFSPSFMHWGPQTSTDFRDNSSRQSASQQMEGKTAGPHGRKDSFLLPPHSLVDQ